MALGAVFGVGRLGGRGWVQGFVLLVVIHYTDTAIYAFEASVFC